MSYLSVRKFWDYQNADVWKKSKGHPPWFKYFVHRDMHIDELPLTVRLIWVELLACATRYGNVLKSDPEWLARETRTTPEAIREALPVLLKGGWLRETDSPRRSRKPSRTDGRDNSRALKEESRKEVTYPRAVDVGVKQDAEEVVHSPGISNSNNPGEVRSLIAKSLNEEAA